MARHAYRLIQDLETTDNVVEVQDFADGPGKGNNPPQISTMQDQFLFLKQIEYLPDSVDAA